MELEAFSVWLQDIAVVHKPVHDRQTQRRQNEMGEYRQAKEPYVVNFRRRKSRQEERSRLSCERL